MPGRKYQQDGKDYRYSINGQEKDKELNESITTAEYWEYDSRIGRRWNVDPKPNISLSNYSVFMNNPINFIDIKGDTLDVSMANANSERDLRLTVISENQKFVEVSAKGEVTISADFKKLSKSQQSAILKEDAGLSNLYDMVESKKNFFYITSFNVKFGVTDVKGVPVLNEDGSQQIVEYNLEDKYGKSGQLLAHALDANGKAINPVYESFTNLANTLRGDEEKMKFGQIPVKKIVNTNDKGTYTRKYDGVLILAPGQLYAQSTEGRVSISVPRKSFVFHELRENFLRVNGANYEVAHKQASSEAQQCLRCNLGVGYSDGENITSFTLGTIDKR